MLLRETFGGCHGMLLRRGSLKFGWQRFEPDHVIETPVDGYVKRQNGQTRNNGVAGPSYPSTII